MGWIYFLFSWRHFYYKIGLSKTPIKRWHDISDSVKEELGHSAWILPVIIIPVLNMDKSEKFCHKITDYWNFTWVGNGKTEWHTIGFLFIGLITGFIAVILAEVINIAIIIWSFNIIKYFILNYQT